MIEELNSLLFCLPWPWPYVIICSGMGVIAVVACLSGHLKKSGAFAAWVLGICVIRTLRFEGFLVFLSFFVSCNIVGTVSEKVQGKNSVSQKGSKRDILQVMANGLCPAVMGLCFFFTSSTAFLLGFAAAVAESTSDTWAGDLGRLSKNPPLSLKDFRPVEKGMSGGVSVLGTLCGFTGSIFIAVIWSMFFKLSGFVIVVFCGFAGCLLDSVLGAFCQALYKDPVSGKYSEKPCGELVRGLKWLDNDAVNLICNLFSCLLAVTAGSLKI